METPVVGRESLLDYLEKMLDEGAGGVVLVGAGGIGKSRLAQELLRLGERRGFAVARTVGTRAAATVPLGALAPLLPERISDGANLLTGAVRGLSNLAGGHKLMLLVDDAHLLDGHSATLLIHLALSVPSFLIMTVRAGEPLSEDLVSIWKEGLVNRVEVPPLDEPAVWEIIRLMLGHDVEPALLARISEKAQGNPLVARELVLSGLDTGAISFDRGLWRLRAEMAVSSRLAELVAARLGSLGEDERRALELVAFGEPLSVSIASSLASVDALDLLERRGILVSRDDGRRLELWLSHPVHSDVVRASTSKAAAAEHLASLSESIRFTGMRRRGDLRRVASLFLESGQVVDPDMLMAAAFETQAALDMAGTARFARAAWDHRPDFASGLLSGNALCFLNRFEESDAMLAAAARYASSPLEGATVAARRSFVLAHGLGLLSDALELLDTAEQAMEDPDSLALLRAQRACLWARSRKSTRLLLDEALPLTAGSYLPARVLATYAAIVALVNRGEYCRAIELVESILDDHRACWLQGQIHIPPELIEHHLEAASTAMGYLTPAHDDGTQLDRSKVEISTIPGRRSVVRLNAVVAARAALFRGKPREVLEILLPHAELSERSDRQLVALLATAAALIGDAGTAIKQIELIDRAARAGERPFDALLDEARAWTLVSSGHPEKARRVLSNGIQKAIAAEEWGMALPLVHDLARLGDAESALSAICEFKATVDGPLPEARCWYVNGVAKGDGKMLERASARFREYGADLLAADAAADAARVWERLHEARNATRARRIARELAALCQGARTPALTGLSSPTQLTAREREVASLAALGLSNRDIAQRLFVSTRTIDNHLQRAYQKLGLTSRSELAAALDLE